MNHRFACLTLLFALLLANSAFAQVDQILPPQGGEGGGQFFARCAKGDILNGFELRTGDDVDAIRPICVTASRPDVIGLRSFFAKSFGGGDGTVVQLLCPDNSPAIAGVDVMYEGQDTIIVNNVHLYCSVVAPNQPLTIYPTAVFDGPQIHHTKVGSFTGYDPVFLHGGVQTCPQGLIPVGINGRSGIWLDSVGLICGAMPFDPAKFPTPVKSVGRVNTTPMTPQQPRSICAAAADARARNSPAAPNLEVQCLASKTPVKSVGRVNTTPMRPQ